MVFEMIAVFISFLISHVRAYEDDTVNVEGALAGIVVCASLLVLVVVLTLCGGCTPMEVGSDDHAATSSSRKTHYTQYSSVSTDVNTHVMTSGTTFADDPYQPQNQALPYDPHPRTANTFTGYNPGVGTYQGQTGQPGLPPAAQQGYQTQSTHMPGANRPFSQSAESPPPNYAEAVRPSQDQGQVQGHIGATAPTQPYGW